MRGEDHRPEGFFSYLRLEQRIPADHPLRAIRDLVDAALNPQGARFAIIYSTSGTTGICPLEVIGDTLVVEEEASRGTVSAVRVTLLPGEAQILSRLP